MIRRLVRPADNHAALGSYGHGESRKERGDEREECEAHCAGVRGAQGWVYIKGRVWYDDAGCVVYGSVRLQVVR